MLKSFQNGVRDGIPIGLGYLAVSFSLGITARNAGFTPFQGFLISFLENASAGEYICFTLVAAGASYLEVFLMTLISNARYLLMSCVLSQRFSPETPFYHRLLVGYDLTDELFGIAVSRPGYVDPIYMYGAFSVALPCWAGGTAIGIVAGNLLPADVVSALSVALFGMFIAIVIPPAKKDRIILVLVIISFILSFIFRIAPYIRTISSGTRTIILTLLISGAAAALFPVKDEEEENEHEG